MAIQQHTGYITLTFIVHFDEETQQFSGECRELDVATCGNAVEETFAALEEATRLYLDTIARLGDRSRVFRERGIEILPERPWSPRTVDVRPDDYARLLTMHVAA